jgi:hypothetical protein
MGGMELRYLNVQRNPLPQSHAYLSKLVTSPIKGGRKDNSFWCRTVLGKTRRQTSRALGKPDRQSPDRAGCQVVLGIE